MKKTIYIFVFLLLSIFSNAQIIGEKIFTYEKSKVKADEEYLYRILIYNGLKSKGLKNGKYYDKIVFEHFGNLMYVSGKFKENKNSSASVKNAGIPKYLENDQPFSDEVLNDNSYINRTSKIYHSNGKIWMEYDKIKETGEDVIMIYNFDGTLKRRETNLYGQNKVKINTNREGTLERIDGSFEVNRTPHFITQESGDLYLGYPKLGTIITQSGYSLTGFTITLEQKYGNSGVFFLENLETKKTYWATIQGGYVTALQSALLSEKPDIHQLQQNIEVIEDTWKIDRISATMINKMKQEGGIKNDTKFSLNETILNLKSKNIENLNGYGISLVTSDNKSYDDRIEIKVGLFKNGILNGMAQHAIIDYRYICGESCIYPYRGEAKWNIETGVFNNGNLKDGRTILLPNYIWNGYDISSPNRFAGFQYKSLTRAPKLSNYSMKISEVDKGLTAYLPHLERNVTIYSVDVQKGTIKIYTDVPNVFAIIDIKNEPFYAFKKTATPYKQSCNKYIKKPVYRQEDVLLYTKQGETTFSSYTVKGVYYDKVVNTRVTAPGTDVYGKKSVLDHYEDVICYKCNGTGVINATDTKQYYALVVPENNP